MQLEEDGTPYVYWNNSWNPICGHYFWNNQIGARLFCEKMGYTSGKHFGKDSRESYSVDSFKIGRCKEGDRIDRCSSGCNYYKLGGSCSYFGKSSCEKGEPVKFSIECSGGGSIATSSCILGKRLTFVK